jgi:hypothetical protein
VVWGAWLENGKPRLAGPFSMERTGIEPVTSGLQIQFGAGPHPSANAASSPEAKIEEWFGQRRLRLVSVI